MKVYFTQKMLHLVHDMVLDKTV